MVANSGDVNKSLRDRLQVRVNDELVLNVRAATAIGLSFPQSLAVRADRLVQ